LEYLWVLFELAGPFEHAILQF
jgi:hypothetical protein